MAYGNSSIDQYRKSAVTTASPLQLVIMLYDGALRFIDSATEALEQGDRFKQNHASQKAQKIITELMACLDMQRGGDVAQNLFALYTFVYNRLVEANLEDRPEYYGQAAKVLSDLKVSWVHLESAQRQGQSPTPEAHHAA